ncbi:chitinase [Streptomyces sp. SID5785]|nr:chitinase [Streptomyces sp. SID5785]MZD04992.1 chitinase [Streptomyces sp. SID5785]
MYVALATLLALLAAAFTPATARAGTGPDRHRFVVSEAQFERMFPDRDAFFTYDGLVKATEAYPRFAHTGGAALRKREAAAFLANVSHETGGLYYVVAQNKETYPVFCDETQPYGCPAGHDAYYGRGAIMLSWNFNYKAAGDALGLDLLNNPWLVEQDPAVAWKTALWYWNTQTGPGTLAGHDAMVSGAGFGETIRSLNGTAECDGGNTAQMRHRVDLYVSFSRVLHVRPGHGLTC